jgi:hypothetical protein
VGIKLVGRITGLMPGKMGNKWTDTERQYMLDNYHNKPTKEMAKHLNRSISGIYAQADKMKLKKCPEYLKANVYIITNPSVRHQFKKGQAAWNKGMKGLQIGGVHTQFSKGSKPHNWVEDGSERIDKDGYAMIKVNGKFILKHRHIYEQHFGKIPKGLVVRFKDGNKENFSLDNLEKITRGEHQLRNSVHNLPDDLKEVINLKRTITKLITEHAKKQN